MTKDYLLKHKDIPVLLFRMDNDTYKLLDVLDVLQEERLPFGLKDKGNKTQYIIQFNNWLIARGLSESRKDLPQIKERFNAVSAKELMIKSFGMNLTDHYWIDEAENNYGWKDKNYFDNKFDRIIPDKGYYPGIDDSVENQSPNFCVDGSIEKRWIIKNNERILIKGSLYKRMQEPFNEVLVSEILDNYKINHVAYNLGRTKSQNIPFSECKCMISKETEFINAFYVFNMEEYYRKDPYSHFLEMCANNGITDAKQRIDEMLAIDFIIGNVDRHKGNFGIIRNPDTLEWQKIAPLFDNGNCLFYDSDNEEMENWGIDTLGKSFGDSNRLNLEKIGITDWYDNACSDIIINIAEFNLKNNERLSTERISKILSVVKDRIKVFEGIMNLLQKQLLKH